MNFGNYGKKEPEGFKKKFVKFFEKQGFYVVLAACLLIIAVSAILTTTMDGGGDNKVAQNPTPAPTGSMAPYVDNTNPGSQAGYYMYPGEQVVANTEVDVSESPEPAEQSRKNTELPRPCEGEVGTKFSKDSLVFNTTLAQWTTHLGIDILSEEGSEVKAVASGTIEKITDDAMMGGMVILKHDSGNKTIYAGMIDLPDLKEGDKVKRGTVLGHVGNTAIAEYDLGAHLHFEYIVSDNAVDPLKYISGYKLAPSVSPSATPPPESSPNPPVIDNND